MKGNNLKNSIKSNIASIGDFHNQTIETIGKVMESNERNGTCTVNYKGYNDTPCIVTDVQVRIPNPEIVSWFPKKDDYVIIRESAGQPIVVGDGYQAINKNALRKQAKFEKNIFASLAESLGGFLI